MADTPVLVRNGKKIPLTMNICGLLLCFLVIQEILFDYVSCVSPVNQCSEKGCIEGKCVDGKCHCYSGWSGPKCNTCHGRKSLNGTTGTIYDGEGNYTLDTKCSWLISTNAPNSTIRFRFHLFATECCWDHLYIHDGDSVFAPLLAAYSGLLVSKGTPLKEVEFTTKVQQPFIYVHFYSDVAYTMTGFNITYSIGDCPHGCSGNHGNCQNETGQCTCFTGWTGDGCESPLCPSNCSGHGSCSSLGRCDCDQGFKGDDCSSTEGNGLWSEIPAIDHPAGRASHAAVVDSNSMWVIGGYSLNKYGYHELVRYDFSNQTWSDVVPVNPPASRYGHSVVLYQNKLYMYGGVVAGKPVNENWEYDIATSTWTNLTHSSWHVSGHTAHEFQGNIHVIFGYSPLFGYLNKVQIYNIANDSWTYPVTTGATVRGGYGHSSIWDPSSEKIYVYGGYHSGTQSSYNLTDTLYSYDPMLRKWMVLRNSGSPRYLHAATLLDNLMLVFGGNTHNDTSVSYGAKCYSSDFMAYDITCNMWHKLPSMGIKEEESRFGHSLITKDNSLYMFGGFNGVMRHDLWQFEPGDCSYYKANETCLSAVTGLLCQWDGIRCVNKSPSDCDPTHGGTVDCNMFTSCPSCLSNSFNCSWCGSTCINAKCSTFNGTCPTDFHYDCDYYSTCSACHQNPQCIWDRHSKTVCSLRTNPGDPQIAPSRCPTPCSALTSCKNCTRSSCMWCSKMQQCVDTNSYIASFPYGQCTEWTMKETKCPATTCSGLHSCEECQAYPMCGWCNDPSNTGLGKCLEGGYSGPILINDTEHNVQPGLCPNKQWFFVDCPVCQCNGHSTCINDTDICESCENLTTGDHCEMCKEGYFGNPINGGKCEPCMCNGQADSCDRRTGSCFCRTKGVTGEHCDRCDDTNKYYGDPKLGGTCYYQLVTDYQFTFNLSKAEDDHYTQINFMNIPKSSDRDVDFTLNCSGFALVNITYTSKSHPEEQMKAYAHECSYFRSKFEHKDFAFAGEENTTFRVYVYGFRTPFWLQISFSQFPKIDLVHFFVTFFSCFLSLLLLAALLWKIKHKYDSYRRRQQMIVEMQQMASRPFAAVTVEVDRKIDLDKKDHKDIADFRKRKRGNNKSATVAIEPLHSAKAAILTVIFQLPTGHEEYCPNGQSGIAMGSTLITYGNTRKQSVEHIRGERQKIRKPLPTTQQQSDTSA